MKNYCKYCKKFFSCDTPDYRPEVGCRYFESVKKHSFVVIHHYCLSPKFFIIGFTDSYDEGHKIKISHPQYGSKNHMFFVCDNTKHSSAFDVINDIKDYNLLSIAENVASALSYGEYYMLKHRFSKSKFGVDLVKKNISVACYLLENY